MILNDLNPVEKIDLPLSPFPPDTLPEKRHESKEENSKSTEDCPKPKSKRGRKPKEKTVEMQLQNEKKRMERNRVFAKENRRKKKEYIASLEAQVVLLLRSRWQNSRQSFSSAISK
eukprot:TRINITY_DN3680_c0_g1_i4.p2 TRINITY_DN3680_c0_g1~~TRINITY_DN3680_c0_g1_i4.p2  ORF type:complete len:116 (+),score=31.93 TRINITY_DN3680_c0_g1_i4:378-725(+)